MFLKRLIFGKSENRTVFTDRQIVQLIWPLLVEQLLNVLVGMIDVVMVSSLGEEAVSGVSLVDSMNMLIIQILAALTAGGTVVISQYIGAKDKENTGKSVGQVILVTVLGTALISIIFLLGGNALLRLIFGSVDYGVMENAKIYCRITAISFPFLALYNSSAASFRSMGNSKLPMKVSMMMNCINIIGNAICIYGLKWGVEGVAVPTLLARAIAAITICVMMQKKTNEARINSLVDLKPNREIVGKVLDIGIPSSLEGGIFNLGKLMLQSLVSTLGTSSIAGYVVAGNLVTYLYLPGNALGIGLSSVAGRCIGANEKEQAKDFCRLFRRLNYAFLVIIGIVLAGFRTTWIGFYHLEGHSMEVASYMVLIHTLAMVLWPIAFLSPYYLRACGRSRYTMKVSISVMWIFRVGFAYLFVKVLNGGIETVWYAMFIDWIVRAFIYRNVGRTE